jgi:hypothetical protein
LIGFCLYWQRPLRLCYQDGDKGTFFERTSHLPTPYFLRDTT